MNALPMLQRCFWWQRRRIFRRVTVGDTTASYDPQEQQDVLRAFVAMLADVTKDGGHKRAREEKPPWWRDESHEAAIFSHLAKWKKGAKLDPDSCTHPLVHAGWRCLAIAYQELYGKRDPATRWLAEE